MQNKTGRPPGKAKGRPGVLSAAVYTAAAVLHNFLGAHRRLAQPAQRFIQIQRFGAVLPHKEGNADAAALPYRGQHGVMVPQGQKLPQVVGTCRNVDIFRRKTAALLQGAVVPAVDADGGSVYFHRQQTLLPKGKIGEKFPFPHIVPAGAALRNGARTMVEIKGDVW